MTKKVVAAPGDANPSDATVYGCWQFKGCRTTVVIWTNISEKHTADVNPLEYSLHALKNVGNLRTITESRNYEIAAQTRK